MLKTPQEFKHENVKKLFEKVLRGTKTELTPISISISESFQDDFTSVDLQFSEKTSENQEIISLPGLKAKGFVDGLFLGLHKRYSEKYHSLDKIKLVDLMVNPIMKVSTIRGSDAKTSVVFRVEVNGRGISEFQHESRSMIYSSLYLESSA